MMITYQKFQELDYMISDGNFTLDTLCNQGCGKEADITKIIVLHLEGGKIGEIDINSNDLSDLKNSITEVIDFWTNGLFTRKSRVTNSVLKEGMKVKVLIEERWVEATLKSFEFFAFSWTTEEFEGKLFEPMDIKPVIM